MMQAFSFFDVDIFLVDSKGNFLGSWYHILEYLFRLSHFFDLVAALCMINSSQRGCPDFDAFGTAIKRGVF